jgi:uncharacterized protein with HEPN domain
MGSSSTSVREQLSEVRAAAEDLLAFTEGLDEAALLALPQTDRRTYRAVKAALTEIGERVDRLPRELLARHPAVDWRGWASLCEIVSHQHFGPELRHLHLALSNDVPVLLAAVESELAQS